MLWWLMNVSTSIVASQFVLVWLLCVVLYMAYVYLEVLEVICKLLPRAVVELITGAQRAVVVSNYQLLHTVCRCVVLWDLVCQILLVSYCLNSQNCLMRLWQQYCYVPGVTLSRWWVYSNPLQGRGPDSTSFYNICHKQRGWNFSGWLWSHH